MTPDDYADMIDWVDDHWGAVKSWANAERLTTEFAKLDADLAWECLLGRVTGDPEKAKWPPSPAELIAAATQRMRRKPTPALPETTSRYTWKEHSVNQYGEVITIAEAVERSAEARA